eukprot:307014_1
MFSMFLVLDVKQWVFITLTYFLTMIINVYILKKEWKKRQAKETPFITKSLQISSLLTIIFSVLPYFWGFLLYFNGFCYFANQMSVSLYLQFNFMGLYQISRLHYCFAQSQVHSNKGYPNW